MKRIRHDRVDQIPEGIEGPLTITPPAFLFLSLTMSNSSEAGPGDRLGSASRQAEVAAYMGRSFPRQHPFLRLLQKSV